MCYKSKTLLNRSSAWMKYNKIVFRFLTLLRPNLQDFKDNANTFPKFWKKNIDMAQNSSQITGNEFSELKALFLI